MTRVTSFLCHHGNLSYFSRLSHLSYKENIEWDDGKFWGIFKKI